MATSGTYAFNLDAGGVIAESWERCQFNAESMKGWQLRSARVSLNLMMIQWAARGLNLWAVEQVGPTLLTQGEGIITTPVGTIDILEITVTRNGIENTMAAIGRDDYVALPIKTQQGRPNTFWVERVLPTPKIHLYPYPENSTDLLTYWRLRQLQDVSAYSQSLDAPQLFLEAACAGLAARIAAKWVKDPVLRNELRGAAAAAFKDASGQDTERVGLSLTPDLSGYQ